jgi:adenine nucleotide transporter 17
VQKEPCEEIRAEQQYTTFERLVGVLLAYRMNRTGVPATSKQQAATLGRSSLSDWDMFILGAASKLVATGGTYPYVRVYPSRVTF